MMPINRNNYEEYFLLYIDGELPATDKQAVDLFIQTNPDLAAELELLQQIQLVPDNTLFADKDLLFRNSTGEINSHNYEENFLLYIDSELDAAQSNRVETFVLQHPSLQEAFTLLKQTLLPKEQVPFPDKSILYRKTEDEKPVFYLRWTKIAAAAVFVTLVAMVWMLAPVPKASDTQIMVAAKGLPTNPASNTDEKTNAANNLSNPALVQQPAAATGEPTALATTKGGAANKVTTLKTEELAANMPMAGVEPLVENERIPAKTVSTNVSETTPTIHNTVLKADPLLVVTEKEEAPKTSMVQPAVYKVLNTDDERKSLYLGSLEINKDKLRGLFRKAGNIFRSKTKQLSEEDKTETPTVVTETRTLD